MKISFLFFDVNLTVRKEKGSSTARLYISNITSLEAIAETSSKKVCKSE